MNVRGSAVAASEADSVIECEEVGEEDIEDGDARDDEDEDEDEDVLRVLVLVIGCGCVYERDCVAGNFAGAIEDSFIPRVGAEVLVPPLPLGPFLRKILSMTATTSAGPLTSEFPVSTRAVTPTPGTCTSPNMLSSNRAPSNHTASSGTSHAYGYVSSRASGTITPFWEAV